jgi:hypothetical protein
MPAAHALSPLLSRTLNALEQVAWSQEAPSCTATRNAAAAALFGRAGIFKDATVSEGSKDSLERLALALKAAAAGEKPADTKEVPEWGQLLQGLNKEAAGRVGQVGVIYGAARVVGKPELKHCFTIVAAPHVVANRFWVFDTLGLSGARRSAADDEALARLVQSLDAAREIYKNHEKHLRFGIDSLAQRLFPYGNVEHEISEWYPIWLE